MRVTPYTVFFQLEQSADKHCVGNLCLVNGGSSYGNLYVNDKPVCDDYWDIDDAYVACRSMGYGFASKATIRSK